MCDIESWQIRKTAPGDGSFRTAHQEAIKRKQAAMFVVAVIIGMPLLLALSSTGVLVESIGPDELGSMGVVRRS